MGEPVIIRGRGTNNFGVMVRAGDVWTLNLGLGDLTFVRVDHQARLQFDRGEVVIERPFRLRTGNNQLSLDPEERDALGPFLSLYPNTLATASVDARATLRLAFGCGAVVTVPADPDHEAWHVRGPGTSLVVCVPGVSGELAIWT